MRASHLISLLLILIDLTGCGEPEIRPGTGAEFAAATVDGPEPGTIQVRDTTGAGELRREMVRWQIEARGIRDTAVLRAMGEVPRHRFVPGASLREAYGDYPFAIGHDQTISQPYIVAFMAEAAGISRADRVLEIGTGSGYGAAVLAELAAEVYTIEIISALAQEARETLKLLGYGNVQVRTGNGWLGWPEHAPYDAIVVTAAPDEVPPSSWSNSPREGT